PPPKVERPPQTEERTVPVMPGKTLSSKLIKPVGAAVLLLASLARADTQTIGAPQGGEQVHLFPFGSSASSLGVSITDPPFNAAPGGADMSGPIQQAINSCAGVLYFPQGTYLACNLLVRCPNQVWQGAGKGATILQARSGCTNLIVLSATNGPAATWELTG